MAIKKLKKEEGKGKKAAVSAGNAVKIELHFPQEVKLVLDMLRRAGFEAYVVGGSLRDVLMQREPKDWDITTNALPEQIQKVFPKSWYNNKFGTVGVRVKELEMEVTTYRTDAGYSDARHPDEVKFGVSLQEDLARRDFTINAMASDGTQLIDLFGGIQDIQAHVIRAVGEPSERFQEDALRMLRAARFASQLNFLIEDATYAAIKTNHALITKVSQERMRDELMKIIAADDSWRGLWYLLDSGLLQHVLPELLPGVGMAQNKHHMYSVFFHNAFALQACTSDDPLVRLSALLHDVGKPKTKQGEYPSATFYMHEHVGADMTTRIMRRLKFSTDEVKRVSHLVKHHMFYYSIGEITDAGVRRLIKRIGKENIDDIMAVRIGDRIGSGVQKDMPYKLIELLKRIEEVQKDPIDTRMLEIDGHDVMRLLKITGGPVVGKVMNALLEEILDDPTRNTKDYLEKRTLELAESFK